MTHVDGPLAAQDEWHRAMSVLSARVLVAGTPMHHAAMANKKEMMFTLARLGCDWRARADGIDGATAPFVLCGQHGKTTRQQVPVPPCMGTAALRLSASVTPQDTMALCVWSSVMVAECYPAEAC